MQCKSSLALKTAFVYTAENMNKRSFFLLLLLLFTTQLFSEELSIRQYLQKRAAPPEQEGMLSVHGAVQTEWSHIQGYSQRLQGWTSGPTSGSHRMLRRANGLGYRSFGDNEFTIDVDLILHYKAENTWSTIQLEFENSAGIQAQDQKSGVNDNKNVLAGSGWGDGIYLIKAFSGCSFFKTETHRLDFELGRRYFSDNFDSKVQFNAQFDGARLHYSYSSGQSALECNLGAFVIDDTVNHFGYIGEVDCYSVASSPVDLKYSLVSWNRQGANRFGKKHPLGSRFLNSQVLGYYNFTDTTRAYAAYLHNHMAPRGWRTNNTRQANATYAGIKFGEVQHKHDVSLDINYQWVQAQSIPERDVSGIGRINASGVSFYNKTWGGYANYKGFALTLLYGITDNLSLQVMLEQAKPTNAQIGGRFRYTMLEITTIYTF